MRASPKDTTEPRHLIALWLHESSRVFEDRLTCEEDHLWFRGRQEALLSEVFGASWSEVVGAERLIYGDYLVPAGDARVRPLCVHGVRRDRRAMGGDPLRACGRACSRLQQQDHHTKHTLHTGVLPRVRPVVAGGAV